MKKPKISVITVCLNAGSKIERTIQSVIQQKYSSIEYIIVDGLSVDNTQLILLKYKTQIDVVISEPDKGLYDAMNKGVAKASGDLVCFVNAGDYLFSDDALSFLSNHINWDRADLFFANTIWVDTINDFIYTEDLRYFYDRIHLFQDNYPHPSTFYKRSVLIDEGGFDLAYRLLADYEFNLRVLVKSKRPYQYINTLTSVFVTDGLSFMPENKTLKSEERNLILKLYYSRFEYAVYRSVFFVILLKSAIFRKIVRRIFKLKLNRVFL